MALILQGSWEDDRVQLLFDVDARDNVTAVQIVNNLDRPVTVEVTRPSGRPLDPVVVPPPGATYPLPNNRRFSYAALTSDWGYSVNTT